MVEVLVAIVILALVSVGVIGFFATVVETSRRTNAEQTTTIRVKSYLEAVTAAWEQDLALLEVGGLQPPPECDDPVWSDDDGIRAVSVTCPMIDGSFVLAVGGL